MIPDMNDLRSAMPKPSAPPSEVNTPPTPNLRQPIEFSGDWDSIVVDHRQISYLPTGFRVWLTEAQIDRLIEDRRIIRDAEREHPDVPYFRTFDEEPNSGLLIRRLNGEETVGYLIDHEWIEAA